MIAMSPFGDEFEEMWGGGDEFFRLDAIRVFKSEFRCEIDVVHRGEKLVVSLGWRSGAIEAWDVPDTQLHALWPHLYNPCSPLLASTFGTALMLVARATRDGLGPQLPIHLSEQEAIQMGRRVLMPRDLRLND